MSVRRDVIRFVISFDGTWRIAVIIAFLGVCAAEYFNSRWWFLFSIAGVVISMVNRRNEDRNLSAEAIPEIPPPKSDNREFIQGYAAAIAAIIRNYDEETMAVDIAHSSGYALADFVNAQVHPFDLLKIQQAFEES